DLPGPEFLWFRRKAHQGIDLALSQELHGLRRGTLDPGDVLRGIQAHISRHAGKEDVLTGAQRWHGDRLPLQVADSTSALGPKDLETATTSPRQHGDRTPRVYPDNKWRREAQGDVDLTRGQGSCPLNPRDRLHVLHLREALGTEEFLRHVLGGDTDAGYL